MYVHNRSHLGKIVQPLRVLYAKVNTAMAHRSTEIVMPVSAVDGVAAEEVHHIWNIRQVPRHSQVNTPHIILSVLHVDLKLSGHSGIACNSS